MAYEVRGCEALRLTTAQGRVWRYGGEVAAGAADPGLAGVGLAGPALGGGPTGPPSLEGRRCAVSETPSRTSVVTRKTRADIGRNVGSA